jgi:hypothetical protein
VHPVASSGAKQGAGLHTERERGPDSGVAQMMLSESQVRPRAFGISTRSRGYFASISLIHYVHMHADARERRRTSPAGPAM